EYRMKNAIREREERLRHIAAHIPGVVYQLRVWENGDMRMVYVSERAVDIFDLKDDPETFLDAFIKGIHEADQPSFLNSIQAAVSSRTPWDFEGRFIKPDEGIIWFSGTATPARRDNHLYFHGILMDISRRKAAEEELKKMDKLKSIGTLAGGIAHDFNNILAGVFGNISLARLHLESGHPSAGYLGKAEDSMQRATHLTGQLLTFSRGGHPVKEDVRLEELVADTVRFDLSGSRVKPEFAFAPDLWPAKVDMGQIQQVFSNLTINAVQAMPDGGHLHMAMENTELETRTPFDLSPGRYIKATISDDGSGIDPEYVNRIFDPYFTTKQTGSGLGLATVHSIISKHDGHIHASSQPGRGTTFTLYLPASDDDRPHQGEAAGTGERIDTPDIHILVMDDEAMVRDIAGEMLEKNGCRVQTAPDGEMAIEMYSNAIANGDPFDLVIMDLTVPGGLGGDEAIKHLREIDPQVKAIVSSGYADDALRANDTDYGVREVVSKPYTMDRLMDAVHRAMMQ
ncbi:MAG TPA: ATP-binding protein, partial [Desulfosalsimonadaceae bacterium]|nr:ATP-binding protein [Desulfosalsimonadaceae bacterium]